MCCCRDTPGEIPFTAPRPSLSCDFVCLALTEEKASLIIYLRLCTSASKQTIACCINTDAVFNAHALFSRVYLLFTPRTFR